MMTKFRAGRTMAELRQSLILCCTLLGVDLWTKIDNDIKLSPKSCPLYDHTTWAKMGTRKNQSPLSFSSGGRRRLMPQHLEYDSLVRNVPVDIHLILPIQIEMIQRLAVVSRLLLVFPFQIFPVVIIGHVGGCNY